MSKVHVDTTHIDEEEATLVRDPAVGDGTPDTAPDVADDDGDWEQVSWVPTRKWVASCVVTAGGLLTSWTAVGDWSPELTGATITAVVAAITSYLLPSGEESL